VSQVLLGVRNLSLRIAVFVALAAALAWFLGGELFPRAKSLAGSAVSGAGVSARVVLWYTPDGLVSERAQWRLEIDSGSGVRRVEPAWTAATEPVIDANGTVFIGGLANGNWSVWSARAAESNAETIPAAVLATFSDRLEVERQLARVAAGLPLQSAESAKSARDALLRAGDGLGAPG
jgi:hypothetical protein